eukprot:7078952-Heterocapsa_arctica.AAC.1
MLVGDTRPRCVVYTTDKDNIWQVLKVDFAKRGEGGFVTPDYEALNNYGITPKEAETMVEEVVASASLLNKKKM